MSGLVAEQMVAVVIPAKDEADRISATVRAARAIPHVDLVLVVDDGSEDRTAALARQAGAVVVRHPHNRGKAAAMETGAAVVAMRDAENAPPRLLLFVDADLGETAVNAAPLVEPVLDGSADMSIALLPPQVGAGGRGIVVGLARRGILKATGWTAMQPLSGMRCLTREAFEAALPLAGGWGVETGLTVDLLTKGFRAVEVACDLRHRPSGTDFRGQLHRAAQYRDVAVALAVRRARGVKSRRGRQHGNSGQVSQGEPTFAGPGDDVDSASDAAAENQGAVEAEATGASASTDTPSAKGKKTSKGSGAKPHRGARSAARARGPKGRQGGTGTGAGK